MYTNSGVVYHWLNFLFGNFLGDLGTAQLDNSQKYTLLTFVLNFSNYAAMFLLTFFAGFHGYLQILAANETNQKKSFDRYFFLKIAIIMILLAPSNAGLSFVQNATLRLALYGDSFATIVWNATVDRAFTVPEMNNQNQELTQLANGVLTGLVCSYSISKHTDSYNKALQEAQAKGSIQSQEAITKTPIISTFVGNQSYGDYYNMSGFTVPTDSTTSLATTRGTSIVFAPSVTFLSGITPTGNCGSINLPPISENGDSIFAYAKYKSDLAAREILKDMIRRIDPIAIKVLEISKIKVIEGDKDAVDQYRTVLEAQQKALQKAIEDTQMQMDSKTAQVSADIQSHSAKLIKYIKDLGWGVAPIWWGQLAKLSNTMAMSLSENYSSIETRMPNMCEEDGSVKKFFKAMHPYLFDSNSCLDSDDFSRIIPNFSNFMKLANSETMGNKNIGIASQTTAAMGESCNKATCNPTDWFSSLGRWVGNSMLFALQPKESYGYINAAKDYNADDMFDLYTLKNAQDPFMTATDLGGNLMTIGIKVQASIYALYAIKGSLESGLGFLSAIPGVGAAMGAVGAVIAALANLAQIMNGGLMSLGYTLTVVIPFLPIVLWTAAMLGYFIMLIESIAAVPIMMTYWVIPSDTFMGIALMKVFNLCVSVFARPFLMILGLAAAFSLAYVGLMLWNTMFSLFMYNSTVMSPWAYMAFIVVYCFGFITVFNICFGVLLSFSERVLMLIGGLGTGGMPSSGGGLGGGGGGGTPKLGNASPAGGGDVKQKGAAAATGGGKGGNGTSGASSDGVKSSSLESGSNQRIGGGEGGSISDAGSSEGGGGGGKASFAQDAKTEGLTNALAMRAGDAIGKGMATGIAKGNEAAKDLASKVNFKGDK